MQATNFVKTMAFQLAKILLLRCEWSEGHGITVVFTSIVTQLAFRQLNFGYSVISRFKFN